MSRAVAHSVPDPYFLDKRGYWRFRAHVGQQRALDARKRFVLFLAGTQVGKSVLGPWWLLREIIAEGPGDYLAVTPTYPLMQKKVLPEFLRLFRDRLQLGEYGKADRIFRLSARGQEILHGRISETPTQVFFGHAQDPESLESATAKAAWLDEAGQKKFRLGSWEAVQRRLSIHEGRALLTTTPYTLGWLKGLHDRAKDPGSDVELIRAESTMNPAFPRAEFERMRAEFPAWKFNMMYRGRFDRPAGMIYDCITEEHKIPRFDIPRHWKRYVGLDFGGVNTAAVFIAECPETGSLYIYRTYHEGGKTAKQHAEAIKVGEPVLHRAVGGSKSEDQWRREFTTGGLTVHAPPISDVEVGIQRAYSLFKTNRLFAFDDLDALWDELDTYSRETDESGEPTEKIEDKNLYHIADALRYLAADLNRKQAATIRRAQSRATTGLAY